MKVSDIRPSPIAGTWYSANPVHLQQQIDQFLQTAVVPPLEGQITGVIAPHAGYRYSGRTAGHAFASLVGQQRDLVVVLSPMHAPSSANLLTTAHRAYTTPLGPVWVDQEALARLQEALGPFGLSLSAVERDQEHSLEIELPFLQRALAGEFLLLPIMIRSLSPQVARSLGRALAQTIQGRNALLVASTDLSHFYPEDLADTLDHEMLNRIAAFAPDALFEAERNGKGFACGVSAVAAVLWAAGELGADRVEILHHSTSAAETGDRGSVVGYGAAVVLKRD